MELWQIAVKRWKMILVLTLLAAILSAAVSVFFIRSQYVASTLTTISVFFPVVFISGLAGEIFRDFALTVSCALFASLVVALTVIPMPVSYTHLDVYKRQ